jgi:type I restriction enzyme S subunit
MNWPVIKLRDLQQKKRGSLDPSKNSNEIFTLYSIPAYDMGEPQILRGSEIGSSKQLVSNGDVLISKIVPHIRRAWVVDDSYGNRQIASGEWIVFNSEKILPVFFRQFLLSDVFHRKFMTTVAGVGGSLLRAQPRLVADFNFSLPPLAEQQRIAALLDTADRILKQRESAIAKLDQLAQSVFVDMFGDPFSKSTSTINLGEVANINMGQSPAGSTYNSEGVGVYLLNGPTEFGEKYPIPLQWTSNPTKMCNDGDVLFCVRGATAGKLNIANDSYCIGRGLAAISSLCC